MAEKALEENPASIAATDVPKAQSALSNQTEEIAEAPQVSDRSALKETEKSEVETAEPEDILKKAKEESQLQHPLTLSWSFGYNSQLPVHNVSEGNRKMIFYSSAHTGILLDCKTNQQCILQGHSNVIACTAVSLDRRWLVTGDVGPDCMLTVWDSFSGVPVRNIFDHIGDGIVAVAMSNDAQYIATITSAEEQVASIWEWTIESDAPLCSVALSEDYSFQTFITFHPNDPHQLISNSEDMVVFYYWENNAIKVDSHPILDKEFHKPLGTYSQSVLVPETNLGVTGTSEGNGVVWATMDGSVEGPHVKRALKLLKMHSCAITVVTTVMDLVVTGDENGKIQFFNNDLMLVNWYDDCSRFGPLSSISFSYNPKLPKLKQKVHKGKNFSDVSLGEHQFPDESTRPALPFLIPDFVISSSAPTIAHITANGSHIEDVLSEHSAAVNAVAAHPFLPRLLVGSYSGKLKLWDYNNKVVLARRDIAEPTYIQCVHFDPKAEYIGIGYTNGVLQVLDSITLADVGKSFRYSRDAITHIAFSHDSSYMATADMDMCVTLYVAQSSDTENPWEFLAKHRSHYMTINDLMFGIKLDSNFPRLLSLGKDRTLVEYDLENSSQDNLVLLSVDRIEQSAVPQAMTWYPPIVKESFIITANDQYKLKLYNSTTRMCRKTLLGPVYGSPLRKISILPISENDSKSKLQDRRYLVYSTDTKLGLILLPHDGNPHNSKCLVAHPGKVSNIVCSFDGKYVFSAGGDDLSVNMWTVNTEALEAASLLGGEDLEPFYAMLDGGRSGEFFAELEDFFYYAQIRSQGPDVTCRREVSTTISIVSIPSVMRAIGFYPSEQEVEAMINEVKFSQYESTKQCVKSIDLGDFIRLYVNHRPVFGLSPRQIGAAFKVLGEKEEGEKHWEVPRSELLAMLQERGEHLTETDMVEYLVTLLGFSDNPEVDGSFTDDAIAALKQIPEKISAPAFAEDLVGLATDRPKQPHLEEQDQQQPHQQLTE